MATPNYRFDKRQRELKKLKQQEEKRLKKLARSAGAEVPPPKQPEQTP
jgi:hypothetical protein